MIEFMRGIRTPLSTNSIPHQSTGGDDRRRYPAIDPRGLGIERDRVEPALGPLQDLQAASPLGMLVGSTPCHRPRRPHCSQARPSPVASGAGQAAGSDGSDGAVRQMT